MEIFEQFKKTVLSAFSQQEISKSESDHKVDNLIALGVLLWVVAEADDQFLSKEKEKIEEILRTHSRISKEDMPIVLRAIEEAAVTRIDIHSFTRSICDGIEDDRSKVKILESLFRVACADGELHNDELETIRKISNLFQIDHIQFINTKIRVKREAGLGLPNF